MKNILKKAVKKPELLLPAGNLEKLKIGILYGGDAFYMGFSPFSLRCKEGGFTKDDLLEGVKLVRKAGKTFYITMNAFPRSEKMEIIKKHINFLRKEVKPDAIIVADPGVFEMIKEYYPEAVLHMSVQANVLNWRGVKFWKDHGASRIILPRELMLKDIKDISEKVPGIELEFFVHGAICMAYSGRCLLSNYMTGRDSNQGACSHSCRWKYKVYLEEEKRPGQFMPVEEDSNGTYFMNSKDNCLLPYLKDLVDAGICSFKVEGRNKTEYYLATVAKAYRRAIDDMLEGREFDKTLLNEVYKTANRGFIPGYLFGFPADNDIYYESSAPLQNYFFVGMIMERKSKGLYEVSVRNRLEKGQEVEIMAPGKQFSMKVEDLFDLEGKPVDTVHGGAGNRLFKLNDGLEYGTMLRIKA
ncbi:U32 family peptidase C-terminal domain-containing protein [Candidatus Peregrinibacteria bacterium]|nr:U32 family peptidase C-terminal domain-containing protein [Candidatus Peregrinibacteria bacterium]